MTATQFADKVYLWLDEEGPDLTRSGMLAAVFEVATSTVRRWSRGTTLPHPSIQKKVVMWIEENP